MHPLFPGMPANRHSLSPTTLGRPEAPAFGVWDAGPTPPDADTTAIIDRT
ncbi:hypothetical protein SAMN02745121_05751 [Nannocystis exedens]|uniref:Uncharacterized protein n=1 Tax=Nannocystis exedens TaxID=54 RepID=A0A1I2DU19_9BACT|nr:hypothetical protein NAEX_01936 [Nannocystis exedens]SFE83731.1 hypothetical protein SAMN02745121_05751 [Nannocystis exedens]